LAEIPDNLTVEPLVFKQHLYCAAFNYDALHQFATKVAQLASPNEPNIQPSVVDYEALRVNTSAALASFLAPMTGVTEYVETRQSPWKKVNGDVRFSCVER
jgi:hypothetical protein